MRTQTHTHMHAQMHRHASAPPTHEADAADDEHGEVLGGGVEDAAGEEPEAARRHRHCAALQAAPRGGRGGVCV